MKQGLTHTIQRIFSALFLGVLVVGLPFAWIMRDGMGPDAIESSGMNAVLRCLQAFYVGPALLILGLLAIGADVVRKTQSENNLPKQSSHRNRH